jgi:hypothetical protein
VRIVVLLAASVTMQGKTSGSEKEERRGRQVGKGSRVKMEEHE